MKIAKIKQCPHNERDHSKGIDELVESIKDAGFHGMIALRSHDDPTIVVGHGRVEVLKRLGWKEIPDEQVEWLDDLTDEQVERYRINDNKTSDLSTWNKAALRTTVNKMERKGIDMSRFGFDFKSKHRFYAAERLRTDNAYNLDICNRNTCEKDGMPRIPEVDVLPDEFVGFNFAKSMTDKEKQGKACHFFIDDYQFERLWNKPKDYLDVLKGFKCVIMPDFSLYMDMPEPMQRWNIYRSLVLSHFWTENGICVVPQLAWAQPETYEFCFTPLPKASTVAVSTVGCIKGKDAWSVFLDGLKAAIKSVEPKRLLVYGKADKIKLDDIEVVAFSSRQFRK